MRLALLVVHAAALLRGRARVARRAAGAYSPSGPKLTPEWELEYFANNSRNLTSATWGTHGGGACLPFTGGCGHLNAMCATMAQPGAFGHIGACRTYGENVSEVFHQCKLEALNASAADVGVFQTCLSANYPKADCTSAVCAGVVAGPARLRCVEECMTLGTCFSQCTVEYPWPTTVGDCVSNCMGPPPPLAEAVVPGALVHVIRASPDPPQTWEPQELKLAGALPVEPAALAAFNALVIGSIANASGVPVASVRITGLRTETPEALDPLKPALLAAGFVPAGLASVIVVAFELFAGHLDEASLGSTLVEHGHVLVSLTGQAVDETYKDDLDSVSRVAGLGPPSHEQVIHADTNGKVVSVDPLNGVEVEFPDGARVVYPGAALEVPEEKDEACTTLRCGYLRLTHKTMGNVVYHAADAAAAGDSMLNATRVVSAIVDAYTPAPTGPPPTPFPWDFLRKRLISDGTSDPFAAFSPATPLPPAAVLDIAKK